MRNCNICTGCDRGLCCHGVGRQDKQLNTYDWLADVPGNNESTDLVEVQFKNTRKGYYHNVNNLDLQKGDTVAVEANPGHDIGVVTLTGRLVKLQIKKANLRSNDEIRRVYRLAKPVDMEKYKEAKSREHATMIQSRQIAKGLGLQMKIGDVEYQGDGNKAIFYYIADERVDFRQLIKVLAETFHVRIEMKQIGARQEAGRIGGTGPCGRELCCATWMKNFSSVSTNAARFQDISLNPQKLAGMCAKLKCCLNYEVDDYMEASKKLPPKDAILQTADGDYHLFKTDILAGLCQYSTDKNLAANLETITAARAREIIEMNKKGEKPLSLQEDNKAKAAKKPVDLLADADVSRFDKAKKKKRKNNKAKGDKQAKGDKPQRVDKQARGDKPVKADKPTKTERPARPQQPKKPKVKQADAQKPQNKPNGNNTQGNASKTSDNANKVQDNASKEQSNTPNTPVSYNSNKVNKDGQANGQPSSKPSQASQSKQPQEQEGSKQLQAQQGKQGETKANTEQKSTEAEHKGEQQ